MQGGASPDGNLPPPPRVDPDQQAEPLDQQAIPVVIPSDARDRLARMRGGDGQRSLFTSDLSVNEFVLLREAGFAPLGMVVGSSIYHIGWQPMYASGYGYGLMGMGYSYEDQELEVLTQAKYNARELAMSRMEAEADALGADGVIGVRLDVGQYDWGQDLAEFIAIGTAVRSLDGKSHRTRFGKPFTSDLSGQDFRTLLQAGYRPQGLVLGVSVYAAYQNGMEFQMISGWGWSSTWNSQNREVQRFTQATYAARELAMGRMEREARELGAEGIVGMRIEMETRLSRSDAEFREALNDSHTMPAQVWRSFVADLYAVGMAVTPIRADHEIAPPQMAVFLDS